MWELLCTNLKTSSFNIWFSTACDLQLMLHYLCASVVLIDTNGIILNAIVFSVYFKCLTYVD